MNIHHRSRVAMAGMLVAVLIIALALPAQAQLFRSTAKVGTTAAQFLKIGVGARAVGMGGAQTGVTGDISAIYWNPAALSRMNINSELMFNHVNWLADINFDFAAGVLPIGELGTFGLSVTSLRVPEDIVRTVEFPEGDGRRWDASSIAFALSYARNLTDRFSIGFSAKYVREAVWSESASGFALDVGTLYLTEIPGLSIGASISNFGTKMQLDGRDLQFNYDPDNNAGTGPNNVPSDLRTESFDLPLMFRIGLAWEVQPDRRYPHHLRGRCNPPQRQYRICQLRRRGQLERNRLWPRRIQVTLPERYRTGTHLGLRRALRNSECRHCEARLRFR